MEFTIRAIVLSVLASGAFTALVLQIVQIITEGFSGGIHEEEAEDEREI